jgi:hypothetical protein
LSTDPTDKFDGDLTVGEIIPGLGDIEQQPKLPLTIASVENIQHFEFFIDSDSIIGPDGAPISTASTVEGAQNTLQLTTIIDTGMTYTKVPK